MLKFLFSSLAILLLMSGCDKADKFTQFNLDYNTQVSIPATGLGGLATLLLDSLMSNPTTTNAQQSFSGNGTAANLIEKVSLSQMTITVTAPAGGNLNFLKDLAIYIKGTNLGELKIAEAVNIADGLTTLDVPVLDNNLKEYIKAEQFTLRTSATIDGATSQQTDLNIYTKFFVDAKLLGI